MPAAPAPTPAPDSQIFKESTVEASTAIKRFHHDVGVKTGGEWQWPQSTTTSVEIEGDNTDQKKLKAQGVVVWYPGPQTRFSTEMDVDVIDLDTGATTPFAQMADGATPIDDEEADIDAYIKEIEGKKKETFETGKALVEAALNADKVKVQVTGDDPTTPVINVGKVKFEWQKPKKRLVKVTIFPVEWQIEPGHSNFDNAVYTYFSQDELATKAELWADVQIASYAGGELLGAAAQGARTFFLELKGAKSAAKVADDFADGIVEGAQLQLGPGKVTRPMRGKAKVEVQKVDELHEPLTGADAESSVATRDLIPKGGCFVAGTPVWMADGTTKVIELVKKGDKVLSKDETSGQIAEKQVTNTSIRHNIWTLKLYLQDGTLLETTDEHPIYFEGKGFKAAKEAGIGTSIVTRAGPALAIDKIERNVRQVTVYNFTVADFHTYFVGKSALWVHNADECRWLDAYALPDDQHGAVHEVLSVLKHGGQTPEWVDLNNPHWGDPFGGYTQGEQIPMPGPGSNPLIYDLDPAAFPGVDPNTGLTAKRGLGRLVIGEIDGEKIYWYTDSHYSNWQRVDPGDFNL